MYPLLEAFFSSEQLDDESLDFPGVHGFLTAQAIAPVKMPEEQWWDSFVVAAPPLTDAELKALKQELRQLARDIANRLYHDQQLWLPCKLSLEPEPDESELRSWACGFMESVFVNEDRWFADDEDTAAQLLSPIMLASGLFDDEMEAEVLQDSNLIRTSCKQIPETLTDLYLFYQAGAA